MFTPICVYVDRIDMKMGRETIRGPWMSFSQKLVIFQKKTRLDLGVYAYETIDDVPTPESRIILQLYVKTDMMQEGDAIPLIDFIR